ncbi:MAG: LbtU family siderophore porin [Proteobacteria bacterium]|nr:LbtU family siderophore porin [Pseudomonadota bacterium]
MKKIGLLITGGMIIVLLHTFFAYALDAPISADQIAINSIIEIETCYHENYQKEDTSDIGLAKAEIGISSVFSDSINGYVLLAWDEEEDVFSIDDAVINLACPQFSGISMSAGKLVVPFGRFETYMISDPMTLELAETRNTALQLSAEKNGMYGSAYVFNGKVDEARENDIIKCFGLNTGWTLEMDDLNLDMCLGFINNLPESGNISDTIKENEWEIKGYMGGLSFYGKVQFKGLILIGEYITGLEDFKYLDGNGLEESGEPSAAHVELGYTFDIRAKGMVVSLAYEKTDNCLYLELPEQRILSVIGFNIAEGLSLFGEYKLDYDYGKKEGGTGETANTLTCLLALEY